MFVECKHCEAVVNGEELHSYEAYDPEQGPPIKYSFLKCPKCWAPFLVFQENYGDGWDDDPYRIFPPQDKRVNPSFPEPIKNAYQEALACFKSKAFTATLIMCRKTLEGICSAHGITVKNLGESLKEMKINGIIENKLFEWAEALRISGNEAAHDVNITVSSQDAKDIIEFTDALLEYVFTFRDKFDEFKKRRSMKKSERDSFK